MIPPFGSVRPMLAVAGTPFDSPDFAFEVKWDGFRALAFIGDPADAAPGGTRPSVDRNSRCPLRLQSRNGKDLTPHFPELQALAAAIDPAEWPLLLDGEVVAFVAGRPDFAALQSHLARLGWTTAHGSGPGSDRNLPTSPTLLYVVFDILFRRGQDLRNEPWQARRETLESLFSTPTRAPVRHACALLPQFVPTHGQALFAACRELGLEGIVAKRRSSTYQSGRSPDWVKSRYRSEIEAVVGGWLLPEDAGLRLLLGLYPDPAAPPTHFLAASSDDSRPSPSQSPSERPSLSKRESPPQRQSSSQQPSPSQRLQFIGWVGTGWTQREEQALTQALRQLEIAQSPFAADRGLLVRTGPLRTAPVHWVEPLLVVGVQHSGWIAGHRLRQPVWKGWRPDKDPAECLLPFPSSRRPSPGRSGGSEGGGWS